MMNAKLLSSFVGGVLVLAAGASMIGGDLDLSWYTINGGGAITGGDLELTGTVGQAGAGEMFGGDLTLSGGFWGGVESGGCVRDPAWVCDGDVDGDGQVNPVDSGLIQAAFGSTDEGDLCQYDVDCDSQVNPVDSGIVQSLFGTCEAPRAVCP